MQMTKYEEDIKFPKEWQSESKIVSIMMLREAHKYHNIIEDMLPHAHFHN
jgi:hypothetical protein